jgi:hypothetical protein
MHVAVRQKRLPGMRRKNFRSNGLGVSCGGERRLPSSRHCSKAGRICGGNTTAQRDGPSCLDSQRHSAVHPGFAIYVSLYGSHVEASRMDRMGRRTGSVVTRYLGIHSSQIAG